MCEHLEHLATEPEGDALGGLETGAGGAGVPEFSCASAVKAAQAVTLTGTHWSKDDFVTMKTQAPFLGDWLCMGTQHQNPWRLLYVNKRHSSFMAIWQRIFGLELIFLVEAGWIFRIGPAKSSSCADCRAEPVSCSCFGQRCAFNSHKLMGYHQYLGLVPAQAVTDLESSTWLPQECLDAPKLEGDAGLGVPMSSSIAHLDYSKWPSRHFWQASVDLRFGL